MIAALLLLACAEPAAPREDVPWADEVISAPGASDAAYRDPSLAVNGARGGGWSQGGVDVFSIGFEPGDDELVVGFSGSAALDVDGEDLVVFENAFAVADGSRFVDPAIVEVSPDGSCWIAFPHDYLGGEAASADPDDWVGFAGITPVLLNEDTNPVDPFDPELAGGDAFDLADLPAGDPCADDVLAAGAVAIRITPAGSAIDPDTGEVYPHAAVANGPDVDAVYAREIAARPEPDPGERDRR
jgi:hypothetical protein